jgi:peptide/nickel transport system permease protein
MQKLTGKGAIGLLILATMLAAALFARWIAPADPNEQDILNGLAAPFSVSEAGTLSILGTDRLGQDVLSRIIYGARVSLIVAFGAVGLSAVIGIAAGCVAGFMGRVWQSVVLTAADIVLSIPFVLLALALISALGASMVNVIAAFAMVRWAQFARIAYALALEVREREWFQACRASGIGSGRTMLVHVLPNMSGPLLVVASLELAYAILMESGLSFLGLGVPPEVPSWGGMLQEGRNEMETAWWLTALPGVAIMLAAIGFNFLGDWLRDRLDPGLSQVLR